MSIFYYKHEEITGYSNLGDDLNPYLITKVLGPSVTDNSKILIVGIGTLLNNIIEEQLRDHDKKIVFSSGCGYGDFIPKFDKSWNFEVVRGYITKKKLGLSDEVCVGDGAILMSNYLPTLSSMGAGEIVFMPHVDYHMHDNKVWKIVAMLAGVKYVSPSEPRDHVLSILANAKLIITSAMHGAIIADTLRTPWLAVNSSGVNTEKWHDWASALDMKIDFQQIGGVPTTNWESKSSRMVRHFRQAYIVQTALKLRALKTNSGQMSATNNLKKVRDDLLVSASRLQDAYSI